MRNRISLKSNNSSCLSYATYLKTVESCVMKFDASVDLDDIVEFRRLIASLEKGRGVNSSMLSSIKLWIAFGL